MHPEFSTMLGEALLADVEGVFIVTNGSHKKYSLGMLRLSKRHEDFGVQLSTDLYHNQSLVDPKVREAFIKAKQTRDVTLSRQGIRPMGRGKAVLGGYSEPDHAKLCCCDDVSVTPSGAVYTCGCRRKKMGHVLTGIDWSKQEEF